jgi:ABC-type transport system substrate-binding protein
MDLDRPQTQVNSLLSGEIDMMEAPAHDLLPRLASDRNIELVNYIPQGRQYAFRFNTLHKPFSNPKIRQAVAYAFAQKDFLEATIGDAEWYLECKSMFPEAPSAGGWSAIITSWSSLDILDPVAAAFLKASSDKATFGWPCDPELERLRDAFARETDPAKPRVVAEAVQLRGADVHSFGAVRAARCCT